MTDSARKVLAGYVRLSGSDQHEVTEAMNRFLAGTPQERRRLQAEYERAVMGPVGSDCPCCGRRSTPE